MPPKDALKYLLSCGLVNALYSIGTSDLTDEVFGTLVPCPIQEAVGPMLTSNDSSRKHLKLDPNGVDQNSSACLSCTLEFDGSSKGNPGQAGAGAGAIIRSDDGSLICKLREGLGVATSNAAEYRGFILGLKYALGKVLQVSELGGTPNLFACRCISWLYEEAKKSKDKFQSFQIIHVLRDLNYEADNQANLGVDLAGTSSQGY